MPPKAPNIVCGCVGYNSVYNFTLHNTQPRRIVERSSEQQRQKKTVQKTLFTNSNHNNTTQQKDHCAPTNTHYHAHALMHAHDLHWECKRTHTHTLVAGWGIFFILVCIFFFHPFLQRRLSKSERGTCLTFAN